jgi:hypothetical protein
MAGRTALVIVNGQVQQLPSGDTLAGVTQSTAPAALSAGTTLASSGTVVFSNANGLSFGMNGQTVTAKMPSISLFENIKQEAFVSNAAQTNSGASNLSLQRVLVPYQISATRMELLGALTVVGSTAGSFTLSAVVYTMTGSTINSASSASAGVTFNSGTNSTAASIYGAQSGTRWRSIGLGTWNITPGEYMIGLMVSQNGPAGTTGSWTFYGGSSVSLNQYPGGGVGTNYFADGIVSAASAAFAASYHLSGINQTGTGVLRQPFFRLVGTF